MLTKTLLRAVLASASIAIASTAEKIDNPQQVTTSDSADSSVFRLDKPPFQNEDQELQVRYRWDLEDQSTHAAAIPMPDAYPLEAFGTTSVAAPTIVPEPGTMILLGTGLAFLAARRIRRPI